jgi:hypothetical protein
VTQHVFENYAIQRNFALGLAKGTWILFLDADERLTIAKNEIIQTVKNKERYTAYYFNRTLCFVINDYTTAVGKQIKSSDFSEKKSQLLLQKTVHEKLHTNGETGKLKNKLIHYSYTTTLLTKKKMISYGKLKANEEFTKGTKPNFFPFLPSYQTINQYILRLESLTEKGNYYLPF